MSKRIEPMFALGDDLTIVAQHPDAGRAIRVKLTPSQAYELAARLIEQAEHAEGRLAPLTGTAALN